MKKALLALLIIFIVIQFIHPAKNQSMAAQPNDIFSLYPASDTVKNLVVSSCYDCHSNNTNYPWYSKVQPVDCWMTHHVNEGKEELNFSEFGSYKSGKARRKLDEAADELKEKGMPLPSYTWMHHEARLSDADKKLIIDWAMDTQKKLPASEQSPSSLAR